MNYIPVSLDIWIYELDINPIIAIILTHFIMAVVSTIVLFEFDILGMFLKEL